MKLRIGTRGSKLALKQVEIVMNKISSWNLKKYFKEDLDLDIENYEVVKIVTEGDKKSKRGEEQFDKAHFVSCIEQKLLNNEIDFAIHSAKDMPANATEGLVNYYPYFGELNQSPDLLIFRDGFEPNFTNDMKLGTSSLRRKMQAKFFLKARNVCSLRGNIDTRIQKLYDGEFDCIVLSKAGIDRLELNVNAIELPHATSFLQGTICLQTRQDSQISDKLSLNSPWWKNTGLSWWECFHFDDEVNLGKKFLSSIGADCHSAIALKAENDFFFGASISAEIYGKKDWIKIESSSSIDYEERSTDKIALGYYNESDLKVCLDSAIRSFHEQNGKVLLNEHY